MQRHRARGRLLVDHDRDRTALHAFTKRDAATAGEPGVRESLHRPESYHQRSDLISFSNWSLPDSPTCFAQILPSREITSVMGNPNIGPKASSRSSRPLPSTIV